MKNTTNQRTLSLRTHTIRDLTAEDLRLAVGGRSGSAGSGHGAGSGSDRRGTYRSSSGDTMPSQFGRPAASAV